MEMNYINTSLYAHCVRSNENFAEDFLSLYKDAARSISKETLVKAFLGNHKDLQEQKLAA